MIIARYLIKEVTATTAAVLLVLLLIGLGHEFVGYLADAVASGLSLSLVFHVLLLNIPLLLSLLLPLAFYFGVLLGLGRMYAEAEITALFACGWSVRQLFKTLLVPAVVVFLLTGAMNFWLMPHYSYELTRVIAQAEKDILSHALVPGRFTTTENGRYVIYIDSVNSKRTQAEDVFIAEEIGAEGEIRVLLSQSARQMQTEQGDQYIVLEQGRRYQGIPGQADYEWIIFDEYGVYLRKETPQFRVEERSHSTATLFTNRTPKNSAELQWRLSLTFSVLVLTGFAVVLSRVKPRQGKYANMLSAIMVAIVYINLMLMAKGWTADRHIPVALGVWWVPFIGAIAAGLGIAWQNGDLLRWKWRRLI